MEEERAEGGQEPTPRLYAINFVASKLLGYYFYLFVLVGRSNMIFFSLCFLPMRDFLRIALAVLVAGRSLEHVQLIGA